MCRVIVTDTCAIAAIKTVHANTRGSPFASVMVNPRGVSSLRNDIICLSQLEHPYIVKVCYCIAYNLKACDKCKMAFAVASVSCRSAHVWAYRLPNRCNFPSHRCRLQSFFFLWQMFDSADQWPANRMFIAMEFLGGVDLQQRMYNCNYLSEMNSKYFFIQMVSAIKYCHGCSLPIVHRNLSPHNVLLASNEMLAPIQVKITCISTCKPCRIVIFLMLFRVSIYFLKVAIPLPMHFNVTIY